MMLQNIMENYLNSKTINVMSVGKDDSLPVEAASWSGWRVESKKLQKVFEVDSLKQKEAFVIEILKYDRDTDCIIETRIKNSKVAVILHAISPDLSEIEFEAKVDIDKIRKDVVYYYAKKV